MSITFSYRGCPEDTELNVANRNGYVILRELLGLASPECYGSIGAIQMLRELSVATSRTSGAVIAGSDTQVERVILTAEGVNVEKGCRVIDCGLSEEQLVRYVTRLMVLAIEAEKAGEDVYWG